MRKLHNNASKFSTYKAWNEKYLCFHDYCSYNLYFSLSSTRQFFKVRAMLSFTKKFLLFFLSFLNMDIIWLIFIKLWKLNEMHFQVKQTEKLQEMENKSFLFVLFLCLVGATLWRSQLNWKALLNKGRN